MRGKPTISSSGRSKTGLIPACAGKTRQCRSRRCERPAHPRVCGENSFFVAMVRFVGGSSPRVRGKRPRTRPRPPIRRLIPACAGKTPRSLTPFLARRAHPRVCGENSDSQKSNGIDIGSSPRVRGKQAAWNATNFSRGLIPACAGKTGATTNTIDETAAHPRVCGENSAERRVPRFRKGSSPRVRGKRFAIVVRSDGRGLIPACAGKTAPARDTSFAHSAHPRVCGENLASGESWPLGVGSSPRVRGKRSYTEG